MDYPRTQAELEARFATEEACRGYLASLRWPRGVRCPRCGGGEGSPNCRGLWVCRECRHQASVTAGTIFQDSRFGLRTWFRAIWWVCGQKNGVSALGLQRVLGFGSYETAWTWLHKLRRAMVRPGRERLRGRVEVDETFWGGPRPGRRGRGAAGKTIIFVAAEQDGAGIGRIRLARTPDATAASVRRFVESTIEPGSVVCTDGFEAYSELRGLGFGHRVTPMTTARGREERMLPRAHRVASLLKRWLLGTHQGAVEPHQLDYYLDEFTFRFNRRTSRSRGLLFFRLLENAVRISPAPYTVLTAR